MGAGKRTTPPNGDRKHGRSQCKHLQIAIQGKTLGKEKRQAQMVHIGLRMSDQRKMVIVQTAYGVRIADIIKGVLAYKAIVPPGQVGDLGEPMIVF